VNIVVLYLNRIESCVEQMTICHQDAFCSVVKDGYPIAVIFWSSAEDLRPVLSRSLDWASAHTMCNVFATTHATESAIESMRRFHT